MATPSLDRESILVAHGRTYHGFTLGVKWFCIHLGVLLTFLITTFATPAGPGWGVVLAACVLIIAIWVMNHGFAHSTENDSLHTE